VVEAYQYDIYGQPRFYDGAGQRIERSQYGNVFMFTGRYWEGPLLHLYYYRARYYSPRLGHFLSRDFGSLLYSYARSNPVRFCDPLGEQEFEGWVTSFPTGEIPVKAIGPQPKTLRPVLHSPLPPGVVYISWQALLKDLRPNIWYYNEHMRHITLNIKKLGVWRLWWTSPLVFWGGFAVWQWYQIYDVFVTEVTGRVSVWQRIEKVVGVKVREQNVPFIVKIERLYQVWYEWPIKKVYGWYVRRREICVYLWEEIPLKFFAAPPPLPAGTKPRCISLELLTGSEVVKKCPYKE